MASAKTASASKAYLERREVARRLLVALHAEITTELVPADVSTNWEHAARMHRLLYHLHSACEELGAAGTFVVPTGEE